MAVNMDYINNIFSELQEGIEEDIDDKIKQSTIEEKRGKLKQIQQRLQDYYKKTEIKKANKSRWSAILNDVTYDINYDKIRDKENNQQFIQDALDAYELTTSILSDLKLIHSISTTVTYIDENYSYFRIPDFKMQADYLFLNKLASKRGNDYGIRLKENSIKALKNKLEQDATAQALQNHFKAFIEPFVRYQQEANTNWKINKGVLGETFERHLELTAHNSINDLQDNSDFHLGSEGYRWVLYKMSSGSDPFFTGPDTELAQVKNMNASIISNIRTLIYTIEGVLEIVTEEGQLKKDMEEQIKKIFKTGKFKITMAEEDYKTLLAQSPELIVDMLKESIAQGSNNIVLTYKKNQNGKEITKRATYKINTDNWSININ